MAPEYVVWFSQLRYIFALTSMSLTECPFLYEIWAAPGKLGLAMVFAILFCNVLFKSFN